LHGRSEARSKQREEEENQMPNRREFDHVASHRFTVEISGVIHGRFQAVSVFGAEADVVEFQDGSDPLLRKCPGRVHYDDVTLTKGYVATDELWNWWEAVQEGRVERRPMSIILLDGIGNEIHRWNLYECWPRRWQVGPLDGGTSDCLVEQVVIATEKLELG
jgi:phage tail-like protein